MFWLVSTGMLSLLAQAPLTGKWLPENNQLPEMDISTSTTGLRITIKQACILGTCEDVSSHVYAQKASLAGQTNITVVYELSNGTKAYLWLSEEGNSLMTKWRIQQPDGYKEFDARYHRGADSYGATHTRGMGLATGTIEGRAIGQAQGTAALFAVSLYGPNDRRTFVRTQPMGRYRQYRFEGLPDGVYWMYVESRGQTLVQAYPSEMQIVVRNGQATIQDIEFK